MCSCKKKKSSSPFKIFLTLTIITPITLYWLLTCVRYLIYNISFNYFWYPVIQVYSVKQSLSPLQYLYHFPRITSCKTKYIEKHANMSPGLEHHGYKCPHIKKHYIFCLLHLLTHHRKCKSNFMWYFSQSLTWEAYSILNYFINFRFN